MSQAHAYRGRVEKGQLILDDPARWRGSLAKMEGRRVAVLLQRLSERRSSNQNRWYWGVIVPHVMEHLNASRGGPGLTREQVHFVLKSAFIGTEETPLGPIPCDSKTLSIEQFSTYCEQIRAHAASEWGLYIPSPDEPIEVSL